MTKFPSFTPCTFEQCEAIIIGVAKSDAEADPELYPAEMLREWKRVQVATQEQAARSLPPLTGAEAEDVIERSFRPDDLAAVIAVSAYTLTGTASDIPVQRILVRLGVSRDMASLLLDDFRDAVAHFTKHPVTVSMTKEESGGFSHL